MLHLFHMLPVAPNIGSTFWLLVGGGIMSWLATMVLTLCDTCPPTEDSGNQLQSCFAITFPMVVKIVQLTTTSSMMLLRTTLSSFLWFNAILCEVRTLTFPLGRFLWILAMDGLFCCTWWSREIHRCISLGLLDNALFPRCWNFLAQFFSEAPEGWWMSHNHPVQGFIHSKGFHRCQIFSFFLGDGWGSEREKS